MERIHYYLVNNTRKEFCWFNAKRPMFEEIESIFAKYTKWSKTDSIFIKGDEASKPDLWEKLTENMGYTDLNYHQEEVCD